MGEGDSVFIRRTCPEHGPFSGLIWRGEPSFAGWKRPKKPDSVLSRQTATRQGCPRDCGRCPAHGRAACTVLFEITRRCNLSCPVCFADAGASSAPFTAYETLAEQLDWIHAQAGDVVLQLSGGEPTLHPDLPALVARARALFPAVQLNSNGLLLAERPELAASLASAGLSWVFLQFDGVTDGPYLALRGKPLLETKLLALANCRAAGLSVVLVPTVAAGVNDGQLGDILRLALSLAPTVRGIHLQPMTASGRNALSGNAPALTLPEVLAAICDQSGGLMRPEHAKAPGCEHERCSFHCRYRVTPSGSLVPLRDEGQACCCPAGDGSENDEGGAARAIEVILRSWQGSAKTGAHAPADAFEAFIAEARERSFSVTCMAFQDAMNIDLERLKGCCVHVFDPPGRLMPFCAYNLTALDGTPLHRRTKS
jgi:uncharacterized radical SAM superfamily Fe-S cluster-containing enzyme